MINTSNDKNYSRLEFKYFLYKKTINITWIDETLEQIKMLLEDDKLPSSSTNCKFCNYINNLNSIKNEIL